MNSSLVPQKTRRTEGSRYTLNMTRLKHPPVGVTWKLKDGGASSGVILVTSQWFKITRSVAESPRVAE
ncbi:hypothetical protein TNCV_4684851 [Trichonephila clavipes]|nr:hypothetical protein TNCV_4684851 [Trichonephila clavipes]